jgi:hypothetical protein
MEVSDEKYPPNFTRHDLMLKKGQYELITHEHRRPVFISKSLEIFPPILKLPRRPCTKAKHQIFERDDYTCQNCGFAYHGDKESVGESLICDHIIPIALGGADQDPDNLQTLCINCNELKTKRDMELIRGNGL